MPDALLDHDPELRKMRPERVRRHRLLPDQQRPHAMKHHRLLTNAAAGSPGYYFPVTRFTCVGLGSLSEVGLVTDLAVLNDWPSPPSERSLGRWMSRVAENLAAD